MAWRIDSILNRTVECSKFCVIHEDKHHFATKEDAEEAIELSLALAPTLNPQDLFFHHQKSDVTDTYFLEASFITTLGELAVITAEAFDEHVLGTILIGNRIYGAGRIPTYEKDSLNRCAQKALTIAVEDFSHELWPDSNVASLYRAIRRHSSSDELLAPGRLSLTNETDTGNQQIFRGTTVTDTPISIAVTQGYAVAQAEINRSSRILYETTIPTPLFRTELDRNLFAAKAFGELVASRV